MDEYRYYEGVAETIGGIEVDFLTPERGHGVWPLCVDDG